MPRANAALLKGGDWQKVKAIFDACVDLSPEARARYLDENTKDCLDVRQEVESLLEAYDHESTGAFLGEGDTKAAPTVGLKTLGRYRLVKRLGEGGMAEVFLARLDGAAGFSKELAIKCLSPRLTLNPEVRDLFRYEAVLSSRLDHPNIAPVYEFSEADGRYFLVMEYIRGRNVSEILERAAARHVRLPLDMILHLASELCEALDYAHSRLDDKTGLPLAVVHRDVSPRNVMVTFDGTLKLVDFGIAKARDRVKFTHEGMVRGTPGYMAPEVLAGREPDVKSDLYSAVAVLREMISRQGEVAISSNLMPLAVMTPDESGKIADVDAQAVQRILEKGLSEQPELRYRQASELQQALLEAMGKAASPSSAAASRRRWGQLLKALFPEAQREGEEEPSEEGIQSPAPPVDTNAVTMAPPWDPVHSRPAPKAPPAAANPASRFSRWRALGAKGLPWLLGVLGLASIGLGLFALSPESLYQFNDDLRSAEPVAIKGPCTVDFSTFPAGAEIVINHAYPVGITPASVPLPCQRVLLVTLEKQGYEPATRIVRPSRRGAQIKLVLHGPTQNASRYIRRAYWKLVTWIVDLQRWIDPD